MHNKAKTIPRIRLYPRSTEGRHRDGPDADVGILSAVGNTYRKRWKLCRGDLYLFPYRD